MPNLTPEAGGPTNGPSDAEPPGLPLSRGFIGWFALRSEYDEGRELAKPILDWLKSKDQEAEYAGRIRRCNGITEIAIRFGDSAKARTAEILWKTIIYLGIL